MESKLWRRGRRAALLVCATLPYLVLRYFMGGVNVASEMLLLGALLFGSALLTALATLILEGSGSHRSRGWEAHRTGRQNNSWLIDDSKARVLGRAPSHMECD